MSDTKCQRRQINTHNDNVLCGSIIWNRCQYIILSIMVFLLISIAQPINAFSASSITTPLIRQERPFVQSLPRQSNPSPFRSVENNRIISCRHNHLDNTIIKFSSSFNARRRMASTTKLDATAATTAAVVASFGAIAGAISGGLFAGGLHAVAGPDHLAALLPRCCGQRWYRAGQVGALWGIGHGVSATLLGVTAFAVKRTVGNNLTPGLKTILNSASHVTEIAVGLSLIIIGVMGVKEAREWSADDADGLVPAMATAGTTTKSLSAAAVPATDIAETTKRAVIFNGLLHGFSWDGAPSLAPAIAVATWTGNLAFLSAYAVGTTAMMALVTSAIGEGTRRAGEIFNRPDIPQKLSIVSSIVAIGVGAFWCSLALV